MSTRSSLLSKLHSVYGLRLSLGILGVALLGFAVWADARDASAETGIKPPSSRREILLPRFVGKTLKGEALDTASFKGKRYVMLCFNPAVSQAEVFAQAVANIASERTRHNFELAGVAMGLDADKGRDFAAKFGFDFPIFDDSSGAHLYLVRNPSTAHVAGGRRWRLRRLDVRLP